ncbi:MAG: hypothetical protein WBL85_09060 [Sedimentisphaerales bacterium]
MTMKSLSLVVGIISVFCVFSASVRAVDSLAIEAVRAKSVLDEADFKTIDDFVAKAVAEILITEDFSSISNTRAIIVANSASTQPNQTQFAEQFSKSAQNYISAALLKAEGMTPADRSFKLVTNLLMLTDALADIRLAEVALKYVDSKNEVIRYWAVHCVTNPEITEKLNSPKAIDTARQVSKRLDEIVATSSPDTLGLIASFAGSIKIAEGESLLLKVADRRIASYADWTVERELTDGKILQILGDRMASSSASKEAVGKRFGQLLSYVFQRYIKGAEVLDAGQKEQLVSVLVETEQSCLSKITGKPRFNIKKAIESGDINALQQEHNNLLGDETKAGELNINYGKDAGGAVITHPLALASPPAESK